MPAPRLVAAAAVIGVLLVGGVFLMLKPNLGNVGQPSQTPAASSALGALDQSYHSRRYGYSISMPTDWTATPAAKNWIPGTVTNWGNPALDELRGSAARLVVASQPLDNSQSANDWFIAYCRQGGNPLTRDCSQVPSIWPTIAIGKETGYVDIDGLTALQGTIKPGGPLFDAVAVVDGRGYEFTLDGNVTRADFERLLATTVFTTAFSPKTDNLTGTFTSPLYGYTIGIDPTWTTTTATMSIDDPASTDENSGDNVAVTGTDSHISGAATAMPAGWTFQQWLDDHHKDVLKGVPSGCDGGDPSSWPTVKVGDQDGFLDQLCNAAEVDVHAGDRVYMFGWFNDTFETGRHLDEAEFERVLTTVTFGPAPTPTSALIPVGPLSQTHVSDLYRYEIRFPAAWKLEPGTADGVPDNVPSDLSLGRDDFYSDTTSGSGHGLMVTSAPLGAKTDLAGWSALVAHEVRREFGSYLKLAACDQPTRTLVLDGEPANEVDFKCPGATWLWVTAIHGGRAYQVAWLDDGGFDVETLRPLLDRFLATFTFTG